MVSLDVYTSFFDWLLHQDFTVYLDFIGTFAFAISGIRLASNKNIDLFGALVVGLLTAVGGGTLRDLMLGLTPFWLTTPSYLMITSMALLVVIIFRKQLVRLNDTVFLFDAIGLGFFTVVGMERAVMMGFPFWVAVVMGVVTGSFGGFLRDICINEIPLIFRKDIYALACLVGGLVYGLLTYFGVNGMVTESIAVISVIAARLIAVRYHISLPTLKGS